MASSEVFMIFPAYEDVLDHPYYINKIGLKTDVEYNDYITKIEKIIEIFDIENYNGYYDSKNLEAFLYPTNNILEDLYPNINTIFRRTMHRWGENWRELTELKKTDKFSYFYANIYDDTLCEITKRKHINPENAYLIISHNAISTKENLVRIKYDDKEYLIDIVNPTIRMIALWFSLNRTPPRCYNWNPKHGENCKGAFPENKGDKVSVLMCSKEEVPTMLNMALGENTKTLYSFDSKCNKYIEFKQESENVYHAFHLDECDECRIPKPIKSFIKEVCEPEK